MTQPSILVIDDNAVDLQIISLACSGLHCTIEIASTGEAALEYIESHRPSLVLSDYQMEPMNGIEVLQGILRKHPEIPCVIMTGYPDKAVRQFAVERDILELVTKPIQFKSLMQTLKVALERDRGATGRTEGIILSNRMDLCAPLLGSSETVYALRKHLQSCLHKNEPLLIQGPAGSGKAAIARFFHEHGPYGKSQLVTCSCGEFTSCQLEEKLLAADGTWGDLLDEAQNGTLVINNIEALPRDFQKNLAKHFPQICAEIHVICLTDESLDEQFANGTLDEKLYFELSLETLRTHSLTDRAEDIEAITRFWSRPGSELDLERPLTEKEIFRLFAEAYIAPPPGNLEALAERIREQARKPRPDGDNSRAMNTSSAIRDFR